jgi:hypothetical protein
VTYALKVLGEVLTSSGFPPNLTAAVTAWQAAAVAALQPKLHQLLPESLVQLLVGCSRIALGTNQALPDQQQQQQGRKDTTISSSSSSSEQQLLQSTVLTAAVMGVSQQLGQLTADQLVGLVLACSRVETADKEFGEAVLAELQPKLRYAGLGVHLGYDSGAFGGGTSVGMQRGKNDRQGVRKRGLV